MLVRFVHIEEREATVHVATVGQRRLSGNYKELVMIRAIAFIALSLSFGSASALQLTSFITGADMAGMQVTATFVGGGSETATWVTTSTDGSIPDDEGFAGAATGTGWSLSQRGDTLGGNNAAGAVLGLWTLSNTSDLGLVSVVIDALAANVVFDIIGVQNGDLGEYTPGSNVGRGFQTANGPNFDALVASYDNLVSDPDLYGRLTIDFSVTTEGSLASDGQLLFLADTDKIPVPAPVLLMALGSLGLGLRSRFRARACV